VIALLGRSGRPVVGRAHYFSTGPIARQGSRRLVAQVADEPEDSALTVWLALAANASVAVLKLVAGLVTGSGALLSESAHSAGDTVTELLLLTALRRSDRAPDRRHPFGYGKERYFWSLLAAMAIFISGAMFSVYQGIHTILVAPQQSRPWVNYLVLVAAAGLEGASLRQGMRQARAGAARRERSVSAHVRDPDDPTVKSVVVEDAAALIGLALAAAGVSLHELTGSATYDGAASIAIGVLLVGASFALAQTCKSLLVGQQADPSMLQAIEASLESQAEVADVVDLLTMRLGVGVVLLCVKLDFVDSVSVAELERACVRIESDLREEFAELAEIFLVPVPRSDPATRARVLKRYGVVIADE
jgi:cation diffusion facilitator family transporter